MTLTMEQFSRIFTQRQDPPKPGKVVRRGGGARDAVEIQLHLPPGFDQPEDWRDGWFRAVWISSEHRAIVTYCEGDVIVETFERLDDYEQALAACAEFYATH
jgi:hypothetical protein